MPTAEQMQQAIKPLFPGLMGVEIKEATPERVVATMLVRPDLCTAGGVCHGGAFMAFADTIGAVGTVILGIILFAEPATALRLSCVGLIVAGIVGLKLVT